jgi:molecular chaperone GrpE (heat shock protein)
MADTGGMGRCVQIVVEWKQELENNFQEWLDQVRDSGDSPIHTAPAPEKVPDLYSFFEALCVLRSDVSKSARRSHDTFARFGETLEQFERMVRELSDRLAAERKERSRLEHAARKQLLAPFALMAERLDRLSQKLAQPPRAGLFAARQKWSAAWVSFEQGFTLLREHFQLLLSEAGIVAMETVGRIFDPTQMKAVAVEENDTVPHNTVIEELAAGYMLKDEVLKFAEVKIAIGKRSLT